MTTDTPEFETVAWQSVVLVCKDCKKRGSGPKGLGRKAVVAELKRALRTASPRPRIVATGCLGVCPKRALAIAWVGGGAETRVACVESLAQIAHAGPAAA